MSTARERSGGQPAGVEPRPAADFDHHFSDSTVPEEAYAELRATCPVAWSERHGGYWVVSRHQDVARVLKDYKSFASGRNEVTGDAASVTIPPTPFKLGVPEELDPPDFHPYKRLLTGVLSPKIVEAELRRRVRHWVEWHIDQVIETGECDLVYDLTSPVAGAVTLEWLGFPQEDWRRISESFHDAVGYPPDHPRSQTAFQDIRWQEKRISEEIALRQRELAEGHLRGDVMAYLVAQTVDGKPMATEMAEATVRLLIAGGVDTTTSLTTSALVHMDKHRDQRRQLIEQPELWDTAVEEFLRRYPPVLAHARTVVREVEVGGCLMRPGERILASEAAACWDDEEFPDPYEVKLDRFPNRHVAFGLGIHRCPGMHLARVTFRELAGQVLERMPDYSVKLEESERYHDQSAIAGWACAPAVFTPGPRRSRS